MKRVKLSERQRLCERHTVRTLKRIMSYRSGLLLLLLLSLSLSLSFPVYNNYSNRMGFEQLRERGLFYCVKNAVFLRVSDPVYSPSNISITYNYRTVTVKDCICTATRTYFC